MTLIVLIITSFFTLVSPGVIIIAPMLFDAPDSRNDPHLKRLFYLLIFFPVVTILSLIVGWVLYGLDHPRAALYAGLCPLAHVVLIFIGIGFAADAKRSSEPLAESLTVPASSASTEPSEQVASPAATAVKRTPTTTDGLIGCAAILLALYGLYRLVVWLF